METPTNTGGMQAGMLPGRQKACVLEPEKL